MTRLGSKQFCLGLEVYLFQFRVLHLEGLDLRQLIQQIRVDLLMAQIL